MRALRLAGWMPPCVACGLAAVLQLALPAPAYAWWGNLEKLSGAGPFRGEIYEFRVACFGDRLDPSLDALTSEARALTELAVKSPQREWAQAGEAWKKAANAWAQALGEPFVEPQKITRNGQVDEQGFAEQLRAMVYRGSARVMATSSAGVLWSLCKPNRERRFSLDVGWSTWDADPNPDYAGGARINLDTLMASISWRVLADSNWDFVEVSAGGGVYWFTSTGFPSLKGVVLQPGRLTFRAPSSWSGKPLNDWRRWAAVPVYAVGITMFPAGFEATDFGGVGNKGVRLPRELLLTQYFFVNVEPFLRGLGK